MYNSAVLVPAKIKHRKCLGIDAHLHLTLHLMATAAKTMCLLWPKGIIAKQEMHIHVFIIVSLVSFSGFPVRV